MENIIEFIEDPFLNPEDWGRTNWTWAYDQPGFDSNQVNFEFSVIKPAKQDNYQREKPTIFTSYLDHPVGMAHAFCEAAVYGEQILDYGLMSHKIYKPNAFYDYINVEGSKLSFHGQYGIGFDELFEKQNWIEV